MLKPQGYPYGQIEWITSARCLLGLVNFHLLCTTIGARSAAKSSTSAPQNLTRTVIPENGLDNINSQEDCCFVFFSSLGRGIPAKGLSDALLQSLLWQDFKKQHLNRKLQ